MPKIIFALLTLGTLAAQAEYSTVHADCLFQNSALAGERLQVWFTFRSAVGLPSDPFPQQVIYSLVSLSSDGTALSRVRAVRSTENLDVKTVDKKLKSVAVISNDGNEGFFLKWI